MVADIRSIYASAFVRKWSFWWAMTTCGTLQIGNYIQTLWAQVQQSDGNDVDIYNGFTEAISTGLGRQLN